MSSKNNVMTNTELSQFVELAPMGCVVVDSAGQVTHANDLAVAASGIPTERLVGAPLAELVIPETQKTVTEALASASEELKTVTTRLCAGLRPIELGVRSVSSSQAIVSFRDVTDEFELSAKAGADLTHDQLTGLPDQYFVLSELTQRLSTSKAKPQALLCVWIDELSSLVDTYGQNAVDRITQEVSERLTVKLRAPDLLGRYEEAGFLALLTSDAPAEELTDIADRLRNEIAFPVSLDQKLVSFTASVAIAPIRKKRPSAERVLALLESSANKAANAGGNLTDIVEL